MTHEQPDGPIVAKPWDDGPVVFASVGAAMGYMEGYDVVDDLYVAWDSRGRRLTVYAEDKHADVEIWFDAETSGQPEPEVPAELLRHSLGSITRVPLELADLQNATLDELIAESLRLDALPGPIVSWFRRVLRRPPVDDAG